MNCDTTMKRVLALDNGRQPTGRTATHLRSCPRCNAEFARLQQALALQPGWEPKSIADGGLTERIMRSVRRRAQAHERRRTLFWSGYSKWIVSGTLIVTGMMTLPYSATLTGLRRVPGSRIDATLAVALGLILCSYIGIFIATHLADLMRLLRRHQQNTSCAPP
ncbi:MAG: hypothetical protein EA384_07355 [Spirochaetaceae bacterium]|nr:MAG: hypothetical protein EA384_07355 [Spirochaetaceae bacterium]